MKLSQMNAHQKAIYQLMDDVACDEIGGLENTMTDNAPGTEDYEGAKHDLNLGHDWWKQHIYDEVMARATSGKHASHARFAGKQFLLDRIEARLIKWGY